MEFSLPDFSEKLGLKSTYTPRHITANIIPKVEKDLSKYHKDFEISYLRERQQKILVPAWCLIENRQVYLR
ncbi:hypothetical protein [Streptococcus castoreus]|uniref:hypothetical protein n=1 Tax=Streptococcus castoreus TaxID=254786 RepID=UPI00041AC61B|nr:hypothetical protein [Streptococcus castoreus]